jgi:hypothetical protein
MSWGERCVDGRSKKTSNSNRIANTSRAYQRLAPNTAKGTIQRIVEAEHSSPQQQPILLQDTTIARLRELANDMYSAKLGEDVMTYDSLMLALIKNYRRKKTLGPLRGQYEQE